MPGCTALYCKNSAAKRVRLHAFPINLRKRAKWAKYLGRRFDDYPNNLPKPSMKLCHMHFTDDQYNNNDRINGSLKSTATPTRFLNDTGDWIEYMDLDEDEEENNQEVMEEEHQVQQRDIDGAAGPAVARDEIDGAEEENAGRINERVHEEYQQVAHNVQVFEQQDENNGNEQLMCNNPDHDLLTDLLRQANQRITDLKRQNDQLRNDRRNLERQLETSQQRNHTFREKLGSFLNKDQVERLEIPAVHYGAKWSESTIKKSLQIRLACDVQGYEFLRTEMGWPLPSYRTLCRRIKKCQFLPGFDNEVIPLLGLKIRAESEEARYSYLGIDEMEINPKIEYDKGLKRVVGHISPEIAKDEAEGQKPASKCLAFVVKGLSLRWKQVVAYLFTGKATDETKFWECIAELIRRLHAEGLNVMGIVTDMGPQNTKLWRLHGIEARNEIIKAYCDHPANDNQRLFFSADPPHLLKNMWAAVTSQDLYLPANIVEANDWDGHNVVSIEHLRKLLTLQERDGDRGIVLLSRLKLEHLQPSNLQKMRVGNATVVFSHKTAMTLRFCALNPNIPEIGKEALPTAWFLEKTNEWFDNMNLRKDGIDDGPRGQVIINQLIEYLDLMKTITCEKPQFKPWQRGVILSITSILHLHEELVQYGRYKYLLTGRMTTDSNENLFTQLRLIPGNDHPGPVETRQALRLVCISQFFYVPRSSNYENLDDAEYILDFLKPSEPQFPHDYDEILDDEVVEPEELSFIQKFGLYYVAAWAAWKSSQKCERCQALLLNEAPLEDSPAEFTSMVSYGGLHHPSRAAYDAICVSENVFNSLKEAMLKQERNVLTHCVDEIIMHISDETQRALESPCHNVLERLIKKFMSLRIHVFTADRTREIERHVGHAGRTVFMRTAADAYGRRRNK